MSDDLVTEARKGGPCAELGDRCRAIEAASGCFCAAAADRIEALTAERDQWKSRHFQMRDERDAKAIAAKNYADFNHEWRNRVEKAEADNARLREALADIVADCEATYPPSHGAIKYAARLALNTGKADT